MTQQQATANKPDEAAFAAGEFSAIHGKKRAKPLELRSAVFRKGREKGWQALDDMITRIDKKGLSDLSPSAVQILPLLYRGTVSSLSIARATVLDRNLLLYLENLSLRAYLCLYGPRSGILENLKSFFTRGFPAAVYAIRLHLLFAFILLLSGVVAGYYLVMQDVSFFSLFVPDSLSGGRGPSSTAEELLSKELFAPWPGFVRTFIVFANSLFRHNTMVGILCFGLGFACGVPTSLLLIYNGIIMGAFIAIHSLHDLTIDFMGWLLIHGVTEILAILLCAAAGFKIAELIIFPGEKARLSNLSRYGRSAAAVAAGSALLFFIAGFLEGGFRQLVANTGGRYLFALVTAAFWFWYFGILGKRSAYGHNP